MEKIYTHRTENGDLAYELGRINSLRPRVFVISLASLSGNEIICSLTEDLKINAVDKLPLLTEWNPWMDTPMNAPIWVRHGELGPWGSAHFAKYLDGKVYAFRNGCTSHTTKEKEMWEEATTECPYINKVDRMVDWEKVPVDTPILVKDRLDKDWSLRYFHSVDVDGRVRAWLDGKKKAELKGRRIQSVTWDSAKLA